MTEIERKQKEAELKALRAEQAELDKGVKEAILACKKAEEKHEEALAEKDSEKMEAANVEIFEADQNYEIIFQARSEVFSKAIQKLDELLDGEDEWERDKAELDELDKIAEEISVAYQVASDYFIATLSVNSLPEQEKAHEALRAVSEEADEIDAKIQEILDRHL